MTRVIHEVDPFAQEIIACARAYGARYVAVRVTEYVAEFPDDGEWHTHDEGSEICRRMLARGGHFGDYGWPAFANGDLMTNY